MAKKRDAQPTSLAELTGRLKGAQGSATGTVRLASPHPAVRHIVDVIERLQARPYATNAVIGGEPGTGKEGLAYSLHELMHPDGAPIITVAVAGRDEEEVSVDLFGRGIREKGERPTDGAVKLADGGTLLLEEPIGLSFGLQRRLLEVLKSGRYQRQAEERERRTQLNIIAITDGNLPTEVAAGRFRHDLYHKLARLDLVLPPLRERTEDVPGAALWMAERLLRERGRAGEVALEQDEPSHNGEIVLRKAAIDALSQHSWPGNFRELEIIIERALLLYGDGRQVTSADIARALNHPRS